MGVQIITFIQIKFQQFLFSLIAPQNTFQETRNPLKIQDSITQITPLAGGQANAEAFEATEELFGKSRYFWSVSVVSRASPELLAGVERMQLDIYKSM